MISPKHSTHPRPKLLKKLAAGVNECNALSVMSKRFAPTDLVFPNVRYWFEYPYVQQQREIVMKNTSKKLAKIPHFLNNHPGPKGYQVGLQTALVREYSA